MRSTLYHFAGFLRMLFRKIKTIERCPDCHKVYRILGRDIRPEKHIFCIPF